MTIAVVFPGQGSQSVGMLAALAADFPLVEHTFAEASDALGYDLWQVAQHGPADALNATACTQPALLAAGIAVWRIWQAEQGTQPVALAGHSLGEYTALVAAGALNFAAAIRLVEQRGQFMQAAVSAEQGAMAAIIGLDEAGVRAACAAAAEGQIVEPANFNAPGQIVIAGDAAAVERVMVTAKADGAKLVKKLAVSAPSHCGLMAPAATQLAAALAEIDCHEPAIPVIQNTDALSRTDPVGIRAALVSQLHQPVRWIDCVNSLCERGATHILEFGPGKVLAGLNKRISRQTAHFSIMDTAGLHAALEATR